jgi:DNA-binding GntR family transcriptional regulator
VTSPDIPSLRKPPNPSGQLSADLLLASELDARILALQVGEPVMFVHGVTYLDDGRAIEVEESHFRAECRFSRSWEWLLCCKGSAQP